MQYVGGGGFGSFLSVLTVEKSDGILLPLLSARNSFEVLLSLSLILPGSDRLEEHSSFPPFRFIPTP